MGVELRLLYFPNSFYERLLGSRVYRKAGYQDPGLLRCDRLCLGLLYKKLIHLHSGECLWTIQQRSVFHRLHLLGGSVFESLVQTRQIRVSLQAPGIVLRDLCNRDREVLTGPNRFQAAKLSFDRHFLLPELESGIV